MNALILSWMVAFCLSADNDTTPKALVAPLATSTFTGMVTPLADVLAKQKIAHDADATATLVLLMADGKIFPLVKNLESRLFFLDKRLLNRPMQLTGQLVSGSQMLQVKETRSVKDGVLHDIYYWCEKCQLRFPHAGPCTCCGAETELWEEPIKTVARKSKK